MRSLDRALAILDALASTPSGLGLVDLSRRVGIAKSTGHRLISTLERRGFVIRSTDDGRYMLGFKVLGWLGAGAPPTVRGVLEELAAHSGESVNLGVLHGAEVLYVERVESRHALRWGLSVGSRVPVHASGMGKAIMAELPAGVRGRLLETLMLQPLTARTITGLDTLEEELRRVHADGYAIDEEEYMEGVCCIAAAVLRGSDIVGAVSIAGPAVRFTRAVALSQRPALFHTVRVLANLCTVASPGGDAGVWQDDVDDDDHR